MQRFYTSIQQLLLLVRIGKDIQSKFILVLSLLRLKTGRGRSFTCSLAIDGKHSVSVHFSGTRDEFTILKDLFISKEYEAPDSTAVQNILDLGANVGLASAWFRLKYPNALIHAYEPAPRAFKLLQENAKNIGNIKIFAEAIGAQTGTIPFNESDRSVASSVINSTALETSHEVPVPMTTVDIAIERMGSVDLLKIDIEGAEFDALTASTQLNKVAFIVGEAHPKAAGHEVAEIQDALSPTHMVTIKNEGRLALFYAIPKSNS